MNTTEMKYQIGGSLRSNDPTYVVRPADRQLYNALKAGKFCYVLNARQMGKSSLLQRTSDRLQKEGCACVYLDITQLGSEAITPLQWYRGIITVLYYGFNLSEYVNLKHWWEQQSELSPVQQLHCFMENVLLPSIQNNHIFIFIDEIDSSLRLRFPVSEFFDWIWCCYQCRDRNSDFNRVGFALFGVATPSDLMADNRRTPFNMGTAIELHGFQLHEATPLLRKLESHVNQPEAVLREILYWTCGQPFLTQKLCQLVLQTIWGTTARNFNLSPGMEAFWIKQLVQSYIIQHWEWQDEPEHLRTIRDRLLFNNQRAPRRLRIYQQVLEAEQAESREAKNRWNSRRSFGSVPLNNSSEQAELLLTGLVENRQGSLCIKNPIYRSVFNAEWVRKQQSNLCSSCV